MLYRGLLVLSLLTLPMHSYAMIRDENVENVPFYIKRGSQTRTPKTSPSLQPTHKKTRISSPGSESDLSSAHSFQSSLSLTDLDDYSLTSSDHTQSSLPWMDLDFDSDSDSDTEIYSYVNSRLASSPLPSELPTPNLHFLPSTDDFSPDLKTPPRSPLKPVDSETPLTKDTETPLSKFLSPLKRKMAQTKKLTSPKVREIFSQSQLLEFYNTQEFSGKTVFYQDVLFDPDALVMNNKGEWETNLERMKEGRCPVGHRGIVEKENVEGKSKDEIRRQQLEYRIELQHVTQKDTNTEDDPICEMTHAAHMSTNTNFVLQIDSERRIKIVEKHLTVKEAKQYVEEHPECFIRTNILHFRDGPSHINRSEFRAWREKYWGHRANQIESLQKKLFE